MILRSASINYNFLNSVSIIFLMHKFTLFNCKGDIFKELVFPSEELTKAYMHMLAEDPDKSKYWVEFKKVGDKDVVKVEHQVIIVGD